MISIPTLSYKHRQENTDEFIKPNDDNYQYATCRPCKHVY